MLISEQEARAMCQKILGFVKADDAEVGVSSENYSQLRFGANEFTTNGQRESTSVGVTVYIDKKRGASSTTETDDASLRQMVETAEQLARVAPVDREYLPSLKQQQYARSGSGFSEATARFDPAARAKTISDVIAECERAGTVAAGFYQTRAGAGASATKNGNFYYDRSTLASLGLTARTRENSGSGFFLRNHYDVTKLDTKRVAREAVDRALRSRNPQALPAGVYTVILEPQAVADLLGSFAFGLDARSADEGRSPFSRPNNKTAAGTKIFDERISVYSDPAFAELPGSIAANGGLPSQKVFLVKNGTLDTLVYSRYWASEKKVEPTPGPVNVIFESSAPAASIDEMIKSTQKGLLVGRFWYIRPVDPRTGLITGLTRDGVWYIENGAIKYPVKNFRFNQSTLQMLAPGNVELIGAPERVGSSESQGGNPLILPAMKLKEFNFTSQSEAV